MAGDSSRRRAADGELSAHRHRDSRGHRIEPRLALARAQGRGLLGRRALRLRARDGRHHAAHGAVAHRHRRESRSVRRIVVSRAGHHRPVPHRNLRRRAAVHVRARARRCGNRAPARRVFRSLSRRARLRAAAAARTPRARGAVRRAFDPLARAAPVRRNAAAVQHRHEQWRHLRCGADRGASRRSAMRHRSTRVTNGRFRGGWITRHYGKPRKRHSCRANGACHARLPARARRSPRPRTNWPAPLEDAHAATLRVALRDILDTCVEFRDW